MSYRTAVNRRLVEIQADRAALAKKQWWLDVALIAGNVFAAVIIFGMVVFFIDMLYSIPIH